CARLQLGAPHGALFFCANERFFLGRSAETPGKNRLSQFFGRQKPSCAPHDIVVQPADAGFVVRTRELGGPGRTDEMGGDRSPAPCGGTWGCAAPHDELGAPRNCSGAWRRRPFARTAGIFRSTRATPPRCRTR